MKIDQMNCNQTVAVFLQKGSLGCLSYLEISAMLMPNVEMSCADLFKNHRKYTRYDILPELSYQTPMKIQDNPKVVFSKLLC